MTQHLSATSHRLKPRVKAWGHKLEEWAHRGLDQHLRVGITGLSGAGKTAFITALVHQLLHAERDHLPMWEVLAEGRWLGAQRARQPDLTLAPFDYEQAMAHLRGAPPQWPPSTRGISEIRLALRYRPGRGLKRQLKESVTLYLDLVDYPGEWLLDLPMLSQSYRQWCEQSWQWLSEGLWAATSADWRQAVAAQSGADEAAVAALAQEYGELLGVLRQQGATLLQPGRALLPGELAGTPVIAFYPLAPAQLEQEAELVALMQERYDAYCEQVVKPFYRDHFARFDRQVVLVDSLTALNQGRMQVEQMGAALKGVLDSFRYGPGSLLRRLFRPQIDKLLFAATKADHLTVEQHPRLLSLTHSLMGEAQRQVRFAGGAVETMVLSAIRASEQGQVDDGRGPVPVIRGRDSQGQALMRFPGEVPDRLPPPAFWQQQGFDFVPLAPPEPGDGPMPHIRMDHLLQWLLGDKMR
ncbi:YcjX family protein [Ferrimonas balearica]|uniref:YcjX family protein n=1 Tax=Ferrimonas balearica TaxID=44012 RepID=UPI001C99A58C|nr:YcjX family protein [Ferrimonas balearica]MBY5993795.1 YcjX family protein [Ferrimonas balearica]